MITEKEWTKYKQRLMKVEIAEVAKKPISQQGQAFSDLYFEDITMPWTTCI
jgi:hypothetical protein